MQKSVFVSRVHTNHLFTFVNNLSFDSAGGQLHVIDNTLFESPDHAKCVLAAVDVWRMVQSF